MTQPIEMCDWCGQPTTPEDGDWIQCPNDHGICIDCCPCHSEEQAVTILAPVCRLCGTAATIKVTYPQARAFAEHRMPVQEIFPDMPREQRETLISGTHPECWNALLGDEQ